MAEKKSNGKVLVILVIIIAVLVVLMFFFAQKSCSSSKDLVDIKSKLDNDLNQIKKDITDSKIVVDSILKGQGKLETALYGDEKEEGVLKKLDKSQEDISEIQKKFNQRPEPVDVETLESLDQCKEEYTKVSETLSICRELNQSKDSALKLFGKVKENLLSQVSLLKGAVTQLKSQVKSFQEIETKVKESMESLDKVYRKRKFWSTVKNVGLGSITGALALIILKAILK